LVDHLAEGDDARAVQRETGMTTKTIAGTYSAGYLLNSSFSIVTITSSGSVGGFGLVTSALATVKNSGHLQATNGGNGVTLGSGGGAVDNYVGGVIRGGQAITQSHRGTAGYAGGAGAALTIYDRINNYASIVGGGGGVGGTLAGAGGVGGDGVSAHAGGSIYNVFRGVIEGGGGGTGGAANQFYPKFAGAGGAGGAGVFQAANGYVYDASAILGGAGGHGGYGIGASGAGGVGGAGVSFAQAGKLTIVTGHYGAGAAVGGTGGVGGVTDAHYAAYAGNGGAGGAGVAATGALTLTNYDLIEGGVGGAGGSGAGHAGDAGSGGAGAALAAGGSVANYDLIQGGAGGVAGTGPGGFGGSGGDGVDLSAGGNVRNVGTIRGGNATGNGLYGGVGVSIAGVGVITNGSATYKAATIGGGTYAAGTAYGVAAAADSQVTLINYGTIAGGLYSVSFRSSLDTLVVEAGSTFIGEVEGGGGLLDLASGTGTVSFFTNGYDITVSGSMPTANFYSFATLEMAKGTTFSLSGTGDIGATPGRTVIADGALTIGTTLSVEGVLDVGGKLAGAKHSALVIDGGDAQFNPGAALTVPTVYVSGAAQVTMMGNLTFKGVWDQTGGTLTVEHARTLTFAGSGSTFTGELTDVGKGIADVLFSPTAAAAGDTLNGVTINALRVNAANTTFTVGSGGATITATASLDFDTTSTGITGAAASDILNLKGGIFGDGSIGEGQMGLIVHGEIQSQDLGTVTTGLIVNTGAGEDINDNLIIANSTGGVTIQSTLVNNGNVVADLGTLTMDGAVTGTGSALVSGGTVFAAAAFNQAVSFTTTSGTLELAQSQAYTATISGFGHAGGTYLDLNDIGFVSAGEATFSGTTTGGVLTVTDGTRTALINLTGNYLSSRFSSAGDGHNGTIVHAYLPAQVSPTGGATQALASAMAAMVADGAPLSSQTGDPTRAPTTPLITPRAGGG